MNRNYITIAVIAVLLMIIAGFVFYERYEYAEQNERWINQMKESRPKIKEKLREAFGENDGINSISGIETINVNKEEED